MRTAVGVCAAAVSMLMVLSGGPSPARSGTSTQAPTQFAFTYPTSAQTSGHTEPDVIKAGGIYYLYYRSSVDSIMVASSTDGATWVDRGTAIIRSGNRLDNASVEDGGGGVPNNWFKSEANAAWASNTARTGAHSLNLNTTAADADWRSASVGIRGGRSYNVAGYVQGRVSSGGYFLRLRWYSDADATNFISQNDVPVDPGNYETWSRVGGTFTAPPDAVSADVRLLSAGGSGDLYVDDVSLQESGDVAAWDSSYTISPSVVLQNGTYYLFYEGNDGTRSRIGYATSSSPTGPFTKAPANPALFPSGSGFERVSVGTPAIFRTSDTWYLFYHGYDGTTDRGAVAWSKDLSTWTRHRGNLILPLGPSGAWDSRQVAPSSVLRIGTILHVFYEGNSGANTWQIGVASVPVDGIKTKKLEKASTNPILSPANTGWETDWVQLPGVVDPQHNGDIWMYFSGHNPSSNSFSLGREVSFNTY